MKVMIIRKKVLDIIIFSLLFIFIGANTIFAPSIATFKESIEIRELAKQIYKEYKVLDNTFQFKLPKDWVTWTQTFEGGEIIYSLFFKSPDSKLHGFVQVWNIDKPLEQFVNESKQSAVGAVEFKYFNVGQVMVDRKIGYLLDYSRPNDQNIYYKGYEALIEGNNKVYRVSFFVEEKDWKEYYKMIFNTIIQSFKIK